MTPVTSLPRFKAPRSMSFTPAKWAQSLVRLVPVEEALPRQPGQLSGMAVPDDAMAPLSETETALWA